MRRQLLAVFQYWRKIDPDFQNLIANISNTYRVNEKVSLYIFKLDIKGS